MDASSLDGTHSAPLSPTPFLSSTLLLRARLFTVPLVLRTAGRGACLLGLEGTVRTRRGWRGEEFDDFDLDGVDGEASAARNVTIFLLGGFAAAQEENKNLPERISNDMLVAWCSSCPAGPQSPEPRRSRRTAPTVARRRQRWGVGTRQRAGTSEPTDRRTDQQLSSAGE